MKKFLISISIIGAICLALFFVRCGYQRTPVPAPYDSESGELGAVDEVGSVHKQ